MRELDLSKIEYKDNGLIPAIIQDSNTNKILMLGYMNEEAIKSTLSTRNVTFYSRSKNRLWMKGESSDNVLKLVDIYMDCDSDALLIKVNPDGPTCHTGDDTCWQEENDTFSLFQLENIIEQRKNNVDDSSSYTSSLFKKGINKIAQKVGEEAIEVIIEAKDNNDNLFLNESADLLFHYLILLQAKGFRLEDVVNVHKERHYKVK